MEENSAIKRCPKKKKLQSAQLQQKHSSMGDLVCLSDRFSFMVTILISSSRQQLQTDTLSDMRSWIPTGCDSDWVSAELLLSRTGLLNQVHELEEKKVISYPGFCGKSFDELQGTNRIQFNSMHADPRCPRADWIIWYQNQGRDPLLFLVRSAWNPPRSKSNWTLVDSFFST